MPKNKNKKNKNAASVVEQKSSPVISPPVISPPVVSPIEQALLYRPECKIDQDKISCQQHLMPLVQKIERDELAFRTIEKKEVLTYYLNAIFCIDGYNEKKKKLNRSDLRQISHTINELSAIDHLHGRNESAQKGYLHAIAVMKSIDKRDCNDDFALMIFNINLGHISSIANDNPKAFQFYNEAIKGSQHLLTYKDFSRLTTLYAYHIELEARIGLILKDLRKENDSLIHFQNCLKISKYLPPENWGSWPTENTFLAYQEIVRIAIRLNKPDYINECVEGFERFSKIHPNLRNSYHDVGMFELGQKLAGYFNTKGDDKNYLFYASETIGILQRMDKTDAQLVELSTICNGLGNFLSRKKNDTTKAIRYYKEGINARSAIKRPLVYDDHVYLYNTHQELIRIYKGLDDHQAIIDNLFRCLNHTKPFMLDLNSRAEPSDVDYRNFSIVTGLYTDISREYFNLKNYKKSTQYSEAAVHTTLHCSMDYLNLNVPIYLRNVGYLANLNNEKETAIKKYIQSLWFMCEFQNLTTINFANVCSYLSELSNLYPEGTHGRQVFKELSQLFSAPKVLPTEYIIENLYDIIRITMTSELKFNPGYILMYRILVLLNNRSQDSNFPENIIKINLRNKNYKKKLESFLIELEPTVMKLSEQMDEDAKKSLTFKPCDCKYQFLTLEEPPILSSEIVHTLEEKEKKDKKAVEPIAIKIIPPVQKKENIIELLVKICGAGIAQRQEITRSILKVISHEHFKKEDFLLAFGFCGAKEGLEDIDKLLAASLQRATHIDETEKTQILSAVLLESIRNNNINLLKISIKAGADINCRNSESLTPICIAASLGNVFIVQELLTAGAQIPLQGESKSEGEEQNKVPSPLIEATRKGVPEMVDLLLDHKIAVDATDNKEQTALMVAIRNANQVAFSPHENKLIRYERIIRSLLNHNADLSKAEDLLIRNDRNPIYLLVQKILLEKITMNCVFEVNISTAEKTTLVSLGQSIYNVLSSFISSFNEEGDIIINLKRNQRGVSNFRNSKFVIQMHDVSAIVKSIIDELIKEDSFTKESILKIVSKLIYQSQPSDEESQQRESEGERESESDKLRAKITTLITSLNILLRTFDSACEEGHQLLLKIDSQRAPKIYDKWKKYSQKRIDLETTLDTYATYRTRFDELVEQFSDKSVSSVELTAILDSLTKLNQELFKDNLELSSVNNSLREDARKSEKFSRHQENESVKEITSKKLKEKEIKENEIRKSVTKSSPNKKPKKEQKESPKPKSVVVPKQKSASVSVTNTPSAEKQKFMSISDTATKPVVRPKEALVIPKTSMVVSKELVVINNTDDKKVEVTTIQKPEEKKKKADNTISKSDSAALVMQSNMAEEIRFLEFVTSLKVDINNVSELRLVTNAILLTCQRFMDYIRNSQGKTIFPRRMAMQARHAIRHSDQLFPKRGMSVRSNKYPYLQAIFMAKDLLKYVKKHAGKDHSEERILKIIKSRLLKKIMSFTFDSVNADAGNEIERAERNTDLTLYRQARNTEVFKAVIPRAMGFTLIRTSAFHLYDFESSRSPLSAAAIGVGNSIAHSEPFPEREKWWQGFLFHKLQDDQKEKKPKPKVGKFSVDNATTDEEEKSRAEVDPSTTNQPIESISIQTDEKSKAGEALSVQTNPDPSKMAPDKQLSEKFITMDEEPSLSEQPSETTFSVLPETKKSVKVDAELSIEAIINEATVKDSKITLTEKLRNELTENPYFVFRLFDKLLSNEKATFAFPLSVFLNKTVFPQIRNDFNEFNQQKGQVFGSYWKYSAEIVTLLEKHQLYGVLKLFNNYTLLSYIFPEYPQFQHLPTSRYCADASKQAFDTLTEKSRYEKYCSIIIAIIATKFISSEDILNGIDKAFKTKTARILQYSRTMYHNNDVLECVCVYNSEFSSIKADVSTASPQKSKDKDKKSEIIHSPKKDPAQTQSEIPLPASTSYPYPKPFPKAKRKMDLSIDISASSPDRIYPLFTHPPMTGLMLQAGVFDYPQIPVQPVFIQGVSTIFIDQSQVTPIFPMDDKTTQFYPI